MATTKPMGLKPRSPAKRAKANPTSGFLNIDLDLVGPAHHGPLISALGPVHAIHSNDRSPYSCVLESDEVGLDLEGTISALLDAIESLDEAGRTLWDQCTARRFNIGIQSLEKANRSVYPISHESLKRVADVGGEIVLTFYHYQD